MTLEEEVTKWNATWRRDWAWREKYKIPFNSPAHREASQIDIHFEYIESTLYGKASEKIDEEKAKEKRLKETGMWIEETKMDKSEEDKLFDKIDLSKL